MYKYILFDLDGTLTDPFEGITNSVIYALNNFGIEVQDKQELLPFIGPPLRESFMKFYGFSEEQAREAIMKYREVFSVTGLYENKILEGAEELLSSLKKSGKTICLATSKPEIYAKRILDKFNISQYFDFIGGATLDGGRNEKADVIRYVLEECGIIDIGCTIMVGDRMHDIIGAKAVGIKTIGVLTGYGSREELEEYGAEYIVNNLLEILKIV